MVDRAFGYNKLHYHFHCSYYIIFLNQESKFMQHLLASLINLFPFFIMLTHRFFCFRWSKTKPRVSTSQTLETTSTPLSLIYCHRSRQRLSWSDLRTTFPLLKKTILGYSHIKFLNINALKKANKPLKIWCQKQKKKQWNNTS